MSDGARNTMSSSPLPQLNELRHTERVTLKSGSRKAAIPEHAHSGFMSASRLVLEDDFEDPAAIDHALPTHISHDLTSPPRKRNAGHSSKTPKRDVVKTITRIEIPDSEDEASLDPIHTEPVALSPRHSGDGNYIDVRNEHSVPESCVIDIANKLGRVSAAEQGQERRRVVDQIQPCAGESRDKPVVDHADIATADGHTTTLPKKRGRKPAAAAKAPLNDITKDANIIAPEHDPNAEKAPKRKRAAKTAVKPDTALETGTNADHDSNMAETNGANHAAVIVTSDKSERGGLASVAKPTLKRVTKKPIKVSTGKSAASDTKTADGAETQPAPRKRASKKTATAIVQLESIAEDMQRADCAKTDPAARKRAPKKSTKAATVQPETTIRSEHFSTTTSPVVHNVDEPAATTSLDSAIGIPELDKAPARRRAWTPPTEVLHVPVTVEEHGAERASEDRNHDDVMTSVVETAVADGEGPQQPDDFSAQLQKFSYNAPTLPKKSGEAGHPIEGEAKATEPVKAPVKRGTNKKTDASEPAEPKKKRAPKAKAPPKPKAPRKPKAPPKKPTTITGLATAAYLPVVELLSLPDSSPSGGLSSYFAVDPVPELDLPSKSTKRKASNEQPTKRNSKAKSVKISNNVAALLPEVASPRTARHNMESQEYLFGTSSQLATTESPEELSDLQRALALSEADEYEPQMVLYDGESCSEPTMSIVMDSFQRNLGGPGGVVGVGLGNYSKNRVPSAPHGTSLSVGQGDRDLWSPAARNAEGSTYRAEDADTQRSRTLTEVVPDVEVDVEDDDVIIDADSETAVEGWCVVTVPSSQPDPTNDTETASLAASSTTTANKPRRPKSDVQLRALFPLEHTDLYTQIDSLLLGTPRGTPTHPSWLEKILLYDPIVVEHFCAWLVEKGVRYRGIEEKSVGLEVLREAWDEEPRGWMAQKYLEDRGVCCLWEGGLRGGVKKGRY